MKIAAGQKRRDDVRFRKRANVAAVEALKMIGAGGADLDREARAAASRKLFRVNARREAAFAALVENAPRLRHSESSTIAIDVAEFGQAVESDLRYQKSRQKIRVVAGAAAKFGGTTCPPRKVETISRGCSRCNSRRSRSVFSSDAASSP